MNLAQLEAAFLAFRQAILIKIKELMDAITDLQSKTDCCRCSGEPYYRTVSNVNALEQDEGGNWRLVEGFQRVVDKFPLGCLTVDQLDTTKGIAFYQDAILFCHYVSEEDINDPNTGWQIYDWIRRA